MLMSKTFVQSVAVGCCVLTFAVRADAQVTEEEALSKMNEAAEDYAAAISERDDILEVQQEWNDNSAEAKAIAEAIGGQVLVDYNSAVSDMNSGTTSLAAGEARLNSAVASYNAGLAAVENENWGAAHAAACDSIDASVGAQWDFAFGTGLFGSALTIMWDIINNFA